MNLVDGAWIPVVFLDGVSRRVSLSEAFSRGAGIEDLTVQPHERIALMRLLICVAQAALDGPADHGEWLQCREQIANAAVTYLARWRDAFELFGEGQRFLQLPNVDLPAGKTKKGRR